MVSAETNTKRLTTRLENPKQLKARLLTAKLNGSMLAISSVQSTRPLRSRPVEPHPSGAGSVINQGSTRACRSATRNLKSPNPPHRAIHVVRAVPKLHPATGKQRCTLQDRAGMQVKVRLVRIQLAMASMTLCGAMVGTILVSW